MAMAGAADAGRTPHSLGAKVKSFGGDRWILCALVPLDVRRPLGKTHSLSSASQSVRDLVAPHGCDLGSGYFSTKKEAQKALPAFDAAVTESGKRLLPPVSAESPSRAAPHAKRKKKVGPASAETIQRVVEEQEYREAAIRHLSLYGSLGLAWR